MSNYHLIAPAFEPLPKHVGFDVELANIDPLAKDRGRSASRAILAEIEGVSAGRSPDWEQESGRVYLPATGASVYRDLEHVEMAGPEFHSAWDFVAGFHAMLNLVREATARANEHREEPIRVLANNSDGHSNSYGGHLSVLINRATYDRIFRERLHYLLFLAAAQISSIVITGQGKAGAEDGREPVDYQIAQRADFFKCMVSIETMRRRPLVNSRDETLGDPSSLARLHCIFHDTTLCHTSILLRVGFMQLILAMIEVGVAPTGLIFEAPLEALASFSRDPDLNATARLADGRTVTAVEHQMLLFEAAESFVESGRADGIVAGAPRLLQIWKRTVEALRTRDWGWLGRNLDWVGKRLLLERTAQERGLKFDAPEIKHLDHMWSDLDAGLYWALERSGAVDRRVSAEQVARAGSRPPEDTRAYARARLLRAFENRVVWVDWHEMEVEWSGERWLIQLDDPCGATRALLGDLQATEPEELLCLLGARRTRGHRIPMEQRVLLQSK